MAINAEMSVIKISNILVQELIKSKCASSLENL